MTEPDKNEGQKAKPAGDSARPKSSKPLTNEELMASRKHMKSIFRQDVLYSLPIHGRPHMQRGIISTDNEHGAMYHIARLDPADPEKGAEIELAFTFEEVDELSQAVLAGDASVLKERGLARKLAAVCRFAFYDADYKLMRPHEDQPISVAVRLGAKPESVQK